MFLEFFEDTYEAKKAKDQKTKIEDLG